MTLNSTKRILKDRSCNWYRWRGWDRDAIRRKADTVYQCDYPGSGSRTLEEAVYFQDSAELDIEVWSDIDVDESFICAFSDVGVFGPCAMTVADGYYILEEELGSPLKLLDSAIQTAKVGMVPVRLKHRETTSLSTAVSLTGIWSTAYYHWFIDYLPRVDVLQECLPDSVERPTVIIPADPPAWLRDSLKYLGYGEADLFEIGTDRVHVETLLVPTVPRESRLSTDHTWYSGVPNRSLAEKMREYVGATSGAKNRIYISRDDADKRRVVNEEEVLDVLAPYGFTRYELTELSLAEQIRLFSSAEIVVGPHGAGLTNMIFADSTVVLELYGVKKGVGYYPLTAELGHEYSRLLCEAMGQDMIVDTGLLERAVDYFLD